MNQTKPHRRRRLFDGRIKPSRATLPLKPAQSSHDYRAKTGRTTFGVVLTIDRQALIDSCDDLPTLEELTENLIGLDE